MSLVQWYLCISISLHFNMVGIWIENNSLTSNLIGLAAHWVPKFPWYGAISFSNKVPNISKLLMVFWRLRFLRKCRIASLSPPGLVIFGLTDGNVTLLLHICSLSLYWYKTTIPIHSYILFIAHIIMFMHFSYKQESCE